MLEFGMLDDFCCGQWRPVTFGSVGCKDEVRLSYIVADWIEECCERVLSLYV